MSSRLSDLHRSGFVLSLTEYLRYFIFTFSERNLQAEILFGYLVVCLFCLLLFISFCLTFNLRLNYKTGSISWIKIWCFVAKKDRF